jgi:hypothetical protein
MGQKRSTGPSIHLSIYCLLLGYAAMWVVTKSHIHIKISICSEDAVFLVLAPCSLAIALMMEEVSISETSVNFYQTTRHNNQEDSHLHIRRRENLKPHFCVLCCKDLTTSCIQETRQIILGMEFPHRTEFYILLFLLAAWWGIFSSLEPWCQASCQNRVRESKVSFQVEIGMITCAPWPPAAHI